MGSFDGFGKHCRLLGVGFKGFRFLGDAFSIIAEGCLHTDPTIYVGGSLGYREAFNKGFRLSPQGSKVWLLGLTAVLEFAS